MVDSRTPHGYPGTPGVSGRRRLQSGLQVLVEALGDAVDLPVGELSDTETGRSYSNAEPSPSSRSRTRMGA